MDKAKMTKRLNTALDRIRPYLQADGGDIRLVDITEDMKVLVELTGACDGCPYSVQTLKAGVEQAVKKEIPEITEVIAINS